MVKGINYAKCQTDSYFLCDHIWYNTKITVGWRSVFSKSLYVSGILSANNLIKGNGKVHALYYVKKNVLKAKINDLEYTGLNHAQKQTLVHSQIIKSRMQLME